MYSKVAPTRRTLAPTPSLALLLYLEAFALRDFNAAECSHRTSQFLKPSAERHQFMGLALKNGSQFGYQQSGRRY